MRYFLPILFIFLVLPGLSGQSGNAGQSGQSGQSGSAGAKRTEGMVTYITSQHVYVKFSSMDGISKGDSLYIKQGDKEVPALQILQLSSISAVCLPLLTKTFQVSDQVFAIQKVSKNTQQIAGALAIGEGRDEKLTSDTLSEGELSEGKLAGDVLATEESTGTDSLRKDAGKEKKLKQVISGRLAVSSYTDFSNSVSNGNQRMRYTFSIRANNLGNSKLSAESYISFSHSRDKWDEVKENIFNGMKIYNLSMKYDFSPSMFLLAGRKINPKLSSVGAIDGLQFEKRFNTITLGIFAGSRPDYTDYSINTNLLQYGAYIGHDQKGRNGHIQTSLAFIEQTNNSMTDRRFTYLQHTNSLVKNLFLFASAEVDLYKKVDDTPENVFDLTNIYLSMRYRIIRPLSISLSYSARHNLIYYESYKDFLERLLETEALQGWRLRLNYHPAKQLYIGLNGGYRFRKEDPVPSKNAHAYLTYNKMPGIGGSVTASLTWLETSYLTGKVYGLGISRELISGKLSAGIKYRYVDYLYRNSESALIQHVGEANLSWSVYRKLSLSVYYEGTFETSLPYNRLYINISQRF